MLQNQVVKCLTSLSRPQSPHWELQEPTYKEMSGVDSGYVSSEINRLHMYQGHSAVWTEAWLVGSGWGFAGNHLTVLHHKSFEGTAFVLWSDSPCELGGQNLKH